MQLHFYLILFPYRNCPKSTKCYCLHLPEGEEMFSVSKVLLFQSRILSGEDIVVQDFTSSPLNPEIRSVLEHILQKEQRNIFGRGTRSVDIDPWPD